MIFCLFTSDRGNIQSISYECNINNIKVTRLIIVLFYKHKGLIIIKKSPLCYIYVKKWNIEDELRGLTA